MNILVINCGSSSLKYQLINSDTEAVLAKGLCERIGIDGSLLTHTPAGKDKVKIEMPMPNHTVAVKLVIDALTDAGHGVVKSLGEINAVGHRVVHGGEKFASSVVINDEVMDAIEECSELAPLHNPANLIGIRPVRKSCPMCRWWRYLTRRFIRPCRKRHICMDCHMNIMRSIRCAVMVFTGQAMTTYLRVRHSFLARQGTR